MPDTRLPEVWLRGQLPGIPSLLQPVAHALLQAKEEVSVLMENFPEELLWEKPAGVASPAFHVQHLSGVLDRLFMYANAQALSQLQLQQLQNEGVRKDDITAKSLVQAFHQQIDKALEQLKATDEKTLNDFRGVGRAQLPSTVIGLLVHGAEHTMRHLGQLLVTVRILKAGI